MMIGDKDLFYALEGSKNTAHCRRALRKRRRDRLLYSAGVAEGASRRSRCARCCRESGEALRSLSAQGVLQAGSDADIVVYDPEADMTITAENQHSAAGYTPFEGFRTHGSIAQVWLRGQLAVEHGELLYRRGRRNTFRAIRERCGNGAIGRMPDGMRPEMENTLRWKELL